AWQSVRSPHNRGTTRRRSTTFRARRRAERPPLQPSHAGTNGQTPSFGVYESLHRTHPPIRPLGRLDGLAREPSLEVPGDSHILRRLALVGARVGAFLREQPVGVPADRLGPVAQAADLELLHVAVDLGEALGPDAVPLVIASDVPVDHPFDRIAGAGAVADVPALLEERIAESIRIGLEELLVGAILRREEVTVTQETIGPYFEGKRL